MEKNINVYDIDWSVFDERLECLEEARISGDLLKEEEPELTAMNEQLAFLLRDFISKQGTTEQAYHPGYLFFARCEQTSSNINACLDAGQPMSFPHSDQSPLIIANPNW